MRASAVALFLALILVAAGAARAQQPVDSVVTQVIATEGGTIELPGLARAVFPAGAFDAPREVTIAATNDSAEDIFFRFDVGTGSVDHEIRIFTGSDGPAQPVDVFLTVPQEYLDEIPANKAPVILVKRRSVGPNHIHYEYQLLESDYDEGQRTTAARLFPRFFAEHSEGVMQAILRISSAQGGND